MSEMVTTTLTVNGQRQTVTVLADRVKLALAEGAGKHA